MEHFQVFRTRQSADELDAIRFHCLAAKCFQQTLAVTAATEARKLVEANYSAGVSDYLQILIANIQFQRAVLGHIDAQTQRLQDTVALYIALGGGWWQGPDRCVN